MDSRQIEEQALAWVAKRDSGRWSQADEQEFAEWLRADTAHRVSFLRVEAGWEQTARLKVFGVGGTPGVVPEPGQWRASPFFERRPAPAGRSKLRPASWKIAGIAATVLVAAGVAVGLRISLTGDDYSTPVGGVASIPLLDGSRMTLNTASKVRVALTENERRIELQTGEAFFTVAKDPARPFVVLAGNRRVVAVGTQFSVRREGGDVQVIVTEGKVRVERADGGEVAESLVAGTVMRTVHDSLLVQKKSPREAEDALSWRSGYLTFDETSLADAVAEFNRYSSKRIVIADEKLAALRINGKFRSTNAQDFVRLLREGFGIQVRQAGETLNLTSD